MNPPSSPARILAYDHIGIRVSDRRRAMAFYQALGFVESASFPLFEANEMLSPDGVRINLIFNGARTRDAHNVLLDAPVKRPGMTHPAFIVDNLQALQRWLGEEGIVITEGRITSARGGSRCSSGTRTATLSNSISSSKEMRNETVRPEASGNCYKVRLFAALADIELERVPVDLAGGAHKKPPLSEMNPLRQVPVLEDDGHVVRDSQAILVYLAGTYGGLAWWPDHARGQAEIVQWLSFAANEVQHSLCAARLVEKFGYPLDKEAALAKAPAVLALLDAHLETNDWLAMGRPTSPIARSTLTWCWRRRAASTSALWQRGALDDPSGKPAGLSAAAPDLPSGWLLPLGLQEVDEGPQRRGTWRRPW